MAVEGERFSVTDGNETQTVTITGTPTGGTFTLTYDGEETGTIAYNANAGTVETALKALSNIGASDVVVGGGPGPGTPWTVEFVGALGAQDVALMTADDSGLTGGTAPAVTVTETTPGVGATLLLAGGQRATVRNTGSDEVYLGGSAVRDTDGYNLAASSQLDVELQAVGDELYGICATGETATVHVLRARLAG